MPASTCPTAKQPAESHLGATKEVVHDMVLASLQQFGFRLTRLLASCHWRTSSLTQAGSGILKQVVDVKLVCAAHSGPAVAPT